MEFLYRLYHFDELIRVGGYTALVLIVFAETGLLAGFFLPGESLLVTAGLIAATDGALNIGLLIVLLSVAAIAGDSTGYAIGYHLGPRIFNRENSRFFHKDHLLRTQSFYKKYGPKTIVLARFVPFVRTFAPTVAGVGRMRYRTFLFFNVAGGIGWVSGMTLTGFFLGRLVPNIDHYLHLLVAGIVLLSLVPVWREWRLSKKAILPFFIAAVLLAGMPPAQAEETPPGPVQKPPAAEARVGRIKVSGDGDLSGDSQELMIRVDKTNLFGSPLFLFMQGRVGQQRQLAYDLHRWGGEIGGGWELDPETSLQLSYRRDSYSVFDVSPDSDPAYRDVAGLSEVGAFGLLLLRDKRDDKYCATYGYRARLGGELAIRGWGGDYNFGRLGSDFAVYYTPCKEMAAGSLWEDLILAEHLRLGWMSAFGSTDEPPFFERYFVGGGNTVRGHRGDWLSPRRIDDQFIGGEAEFVNNVEARLPVFKDTFHRRLFAATFFDMGRAYRRFSHFGDFGYGAGVGLRYVVHFWEINGVLRVDFGVNLARKDDDSSTRLNIKFGSPF